MKTLWTILAGVLALGPVCAAQDKPLDSAQGRKTTDGETREVRIYLIDRVAPERNFKDTVAVLTFARASGPSQTYLFPRVAKDADNAGAKLGPGILRGLPGTPYFVELNLGDSAPTRPMDEVLRPQPPANGEHKDPAKPPAAAQDILRRVHQHGGHFAQRIPVSILSSSFRATITIRLGELTFTSEEFQGPRSPADAPDEAAARVDCALAVLQDKARDDAGFMELRPMVVDLIREISKLAPAGFDDGTGAFELDRQWCLAHARAMERACYEADSAKVLDLGMRCGPRLKEMQRILARAKVKEEPEPVPQAPEVK